MKSLRALTPTGHGVRHVATVSVTLVALMMSGCGGGEEHSSRNRHRGSAEMASTNPDDPNAATSAISCEPQNDSQWYRTNDTLIVDPTNPETMYVNVEWKGFFKTTDGGATWTLKAKGLGIDFTRAGTSEPCYAEYPVAAIDPTNPRRILLAGSAGGGGTIDDPNAHAGGIWESTDGAETWHQTIDDTMNAYVTHALTLDPTDAKTAYYGTSAAPASYPEADPNRLFVTEGILYKTTDGAKTWRELSTGFVPNARLSAVMVDSGDHDVVTVASVAFDRGTGGPNRLAAQQMGILQSLDGGQSWKRIDNLPAGYEASMQTLAAPRNGTHMFHIAAVNGGDTPKSFYSLDRGATWTQSGEPMDLVSYDPHDPSGNRLLGYRWQCGDGCAPTLAESTDAGATWAPFAPLPSESNNLLDHTTRVQAIVWHPTDPNTLFLSGANAYVWKTSDAGRTWNTLLSVDKLR